MCGSDFACLHFPVLQAFDELKRERHSKSLSFHTAANIVKKVGALKKLAQTRSQRSHDSDVKSFKHNPRISRGMGRVAELLRKGGDNSPTITRRNGHHQGRGHRNRSRNHSLGQDVAHESSNSVESASSLSQEIIVQEEANLGEQAVGNAEGETMVSSHEVQINVP